jgi:predicted Ser/Thr protein kinase
VSPLHPDDPERLGNYRLAGRLGSGGMGVVYLGRDPHGSYVAVKIVHAALADRPEVRQRFRSEVERARQVPPFCTAEVLDVDLDHDPAYLVIEYVDGPSLAEVVRERGPLNAAHLHSVAVGVATALTAIHGAGVIHRDLKPENVLLPPGNPKVIDFGIARGFVATSELTEVGNVVGTIEYMAPERLDGASQASITPAADIFAWGCVVAYAGTGRSPFRGDTPVATAGRIMSQSPDLDGLDEPLRGIVEASLVKEPELRPTAREVLDMLLAGSEGPEPSDRNPAIAGQARPRVPRPAARRRTRVGRYAVAFAAVLLVVGTVAALIAFVPGLRARLWGSAAADHGAGVTTPSRPADDGREVLISDPLKAPSQWRNTEAASHDAKCTVENVLTVVRLDRNSFMCSGAEVTVKDGFTAKITATLRSRGSCAALYFHWNASRGGDVLRICQGSIAVMAQAAEASTVVGTINAVQPIPLNKPVNIRMTVDQNVVRVFRGGGLAGEVHLPDGSPTEGRIRLGINVEADAGRSPFTVMLADLEVRSL